MHDSSWTKGIGVQACVPNGHGQEVPSSFHAFKMGPNSRDVEEERRNCFVAITRVKENLTLTHAHRYCGWPKAPSQFLAEMGVPSG